MNNNTVESSLLEALAQMEIIDAHEHLLPEAKRLEHPVDVLTLFSHYTHRDLKLAGMSENDYQRLFDPELDLDERWRRFAPFWNLIRHTSFSRAVSISVKHFFGADDIHDGNYRELSEAMQAANRPGLYDRVLRQACHIRACLTQCGRTDLGSGLLIPVMPMIYPVETWTDLNRPEFAPEADIRTLDDYLATRHAHVRRIQREGTVGLKMTALPFQPPDRRAAEKGFARLKSGAVPELPVFAPTGERVINPLHNLLVDEMLRLAVELDLTVAVHTGYWGDFRRLHPLHLIPLLERHPDVRFDVYHLGYPWVREALMLGKGFPNVWTNFCWLHIISERCAEAALDEAIDLLPVNKLIAFGGDYRIPVEKVYGHLTMARENLAKVLARRINAGHMDLERALWLMRQWLWDNPRTLYRL